MQAPPAQATARPTHNDTRAEASMAASAGPAPPRGQERKDTVLDTLPPRARDGRVASDGAETLSLRSQDARTIKGRQDQNKEPPATRMEPPNPQGKVQTTARTPVLKSQAKVLTRPGAGSTGRTMKGVTTAVVPHREKARATPPSTLFQSRITQRSPSLRATNFKSEPQWDFEEQYSFDTGALRSVSLATTSLLQSPLQTAPPVPAPRLPDLPGSVPRLCLVHAHPHPPCSPLQCGKG